MIRRRHIRTVVEIIGAALLLHGVNSIYPPAAFILGGALLLAWVYTDGALDPPHPPLVETRSEDRRHAP